MRDYDSGWNPDWDEKPEENEDDSILDSDFFKEDEDDDRDCPFCQGRGYMSVESGSSLTYPCPDCTEYEE